MIEKRPTACLGLMSGTSLDGVDGALIITDGETIQGFGPSHYRPYSDVERQELQKVLGRWQDDDGFEIAEEIVLSAHFDVVQKFAEAEIVGFHGQTLAHDPEGGRTHQLGNGWTLAQMVEKPVVWDFRTADVAAGGQGAPLAPFFHFACAKALGTRSPIAFLNLGGVGNVSFVDPSRNRPETDGALLAFDTGPANAPLSDFMQARFGKTMDEDGALAAQGKPDGNVLERLLKLPYFEAQPPKSLDRDHFAQLQDEVKDLSDADAAATLTAVIVSTVYAAQMHFPADPIRWLVCGGGRHNKTLMNGLAQALDQPVAPVEAVGFDGDMFEAQAFGYLAMRVLRELPLSAPGTTGCKEPVLGGQVSKL